MDLFQMFSSDVSDCRDDISSESESESEPEPDAVDGVVHGVLAIRNG